MTPLMPQSRLVNESLERSGFGSATTAGLAGIGRNAVTASVLVRLTRTLADGDHAALFAADPPGLIAAGQPAGEGRLLWV